MIVVTVARRPLASGNVASNVLTHGVGAMNIDGCRVSAPGEVIESHVQGKEAANGRHTIGESWQGIEENYQTAGQKLGRWPANLILEHRPECRNGGMKRIPATSSNGSAGGKRHPDTTKMYAQDPYSLAYERTARPFYGNKDGTETVASWECVDGCPIAGLDTQSGESKSSGFGGRTVVKRRTGAERDGNLTPRFGAESRPDGAVMSSYDDAGGASRFFKQVGGKTK